LYLEKPVIRLGHEIASKRCGHCPSVSIRQFVIWPPPLRICLTDGHEGKPPGAHFEQRNWWRKAPVGKDDKTWLLAGKQSFHLRNQWIFASAQFLYCPAPKRMACTPQLYGYSRFDQLQYLFGRRRPPMDTRGNGYPIAGELHRGA
jgi:hypothetical protein